MTAERIWDDPEIQHEDLFLRRVPRKPAFVVPNLVTRKLEVQAAALQFDADGISVNSSAILDNEGQDRSVLCDWDTHTNIEFPAGAARVTGEAGVVYDPVDDHPAGDAFGKAHSLVRLKAADAPRAIRRDIQAAIAAKCQWVDEDPEKPQPE